MLFRTIARSRHWSAKLVSSLIIAALIITAIPLSLLSPQEALASTTLFSDGFENTPQFTNPAWDVVDPQWQSSSGSAHNGSRKAQVFGNTNTPSHTEDDVLQKSFSTSGYGTIVFSYAFRADNLESSDDDEVLVQWTSDGTTWTTLFSIDDNNDSDSWIEKTHVLPAAAANNPSFGIRFKAGLDNGSDKVYLDDILVAATSENPTLTSSCGLDIALVLDSSGSIDNTNLNTAKDAFESFVATFLPATPTLFSVTDFDNTATILQQFTDNVTDLNTAINTPTSDGATNWEDGLEKANSTFTTSGTSAPNLIVFASDGNPNEPGTNDEAFAAAIAKADAIKDSGTRIITLGIGSAVDTDNLEAISSADAVYTTANFDTLATTLSDLATDLCGGTITIHKVLDPDGDPETTDGQQEVSGWTFDVDGTPSNPAPVVTAVNGVNVAVEQGTYSVSETLQAGYAVVGAECTVNNAPVGTWDQNLTVSGIPVGSQDIVSCTFYNSPLPTLTVTKTVANSSIQPSEFTLHVKQGETDVSGSPFAGSTLGTTLSLPVGSYTVSEETEENFDVSFTGPDCGLSGTVTLGWGDEAVCNVVNAFVEPELGSITLTKVVTNNSGGTTLASAFTVTVSDGQPEGFSTSGNGQVIANDLSAGTYYLSESAVEGYTQTGIACADGQTPVEVGENGAVVLAEGQNLSCTITNDDDVVPATVIASKVVCDSEQYLPNWGDDSGPSSIGQYTASDYVAQSDGHCWLADGWSFQWAPNGTGNPGDNLGEVLGNGWTTFGPTVSGVISTLIPNPAGALFWFREVMQSGYVPFSGDTSDPYDDDSAEFYCGADVLNYDNYDFINPVDYGGTYYCVAFNAELPACSDDADNDGDHLVDADDPGCWTDPNDSQTYNPDDDDETDPTDYCSNIAGFQTSVPEGYVQEGNECVLEGATLTIVKYTEGGNGTFPFVIEGEEFETLVKITTETDEGYGYGSQSIVLGAGTYDITELVPGGWVYEGSYCEYDYDEIGESIDFGETVYLENGDEVTCYFYNFLEEEQFSDLSIEKTVSDSTVALDQEITFTLTVKNDGPDAAENVEVVDVLPAGLEYITHATASGTYTNGDGLWIIGMLASGEEATLLIAAKVVSSGTITNTAEVTSDSTDENTSNNEDSATVGPEEGGGGGGGDDDDTPPGGGGPLGLLGGGPIGGGIVAGTSTGQVLGESCGLYMDKYLRYGKKNDVEQTKKLQEFLNKWMQAGLPITGFFGPLTLQAVMDFQAQYAAQILTPWGLTSPTGIVYITTLRWMNLLECPDLALELPELVEWSKNPSVPL